MMIWDLNLELLNGSVCISEMGMQNIKIDKYVYYERLQYTYTCNILKASSKQTDETM